MTRLEIRNKVNTITVDDTDGEHDLVSQTDKHAF